MANKCNECGGRGLGLAPYLFADDAIEVEFNGLNPEYAHIPVDTAGRNTTADLVTASIGSKSLTGSNIKAPVTHDDSVKIAIGASLTAKSGGVLYFSDDAQPVKAPAVPATAPEAPAEGSKLLKYGLLYTGIYAAWRLLR